MLAEPVTIPPVYYHRHEWRLCVVEFRGIGFDGNNLDSDIIAHCQDCHETMTREQVEAILNGWRGLALTDESEG